MVYVDGDGVLADFNSYVKSINPEALKDRTIMCNEVMVGHCNDCFLASKPLKNGMLMQMVATDPDYYVLTALPSFDDLIKHTGLAVQSILKVLARLRENKYKWFEQQGVPRYKVIVVDKRADKLKYCCAGDVLYDDYVKNCRDWENAGGIGIYIKHN